MQITAAPVTKPLLSVKQLCRMGRIVVFGDDLSYIVNETTDGSNVSIARG